MSHTETIRRLGDLEEVLRTLVEEAVAVQDVSKSHGLAGAQVLRPGETLDLSFIIKMPDGRQFEVIVRDQTSR